ncbi:MAG: hypothetical protein HQK57_16755, partial [Deltaproteobacteria bacterium]|nr:hypothetical protein [Deltaproteobacteria bacterium]
AYLYQGQRNHFNRPRQKRRRRHDLRRFDGFVGLGLDLFYVGVCHYYSYSIDFLKGFTMSDEQRDQAPDVDTGEGRIKFDYIKGSYYRVVHVDGVMGGVTPRGDMIHLALWNERWPIPQQMAYRLEQDGQLGPELTDERISRDAIVREVELGMLMSVGTAKLIRDWLDEQIKSTEKSSEDSQQT